MPGSGAPARGIRTASGEAVGGSAAGGGWEGGRFSFTVHSRGTTLDVYVL